MVPFGIISVPAIELSVIAKFPSLPRIKPLVLSVLATLATLASLKTAVVVRKKKREKTTFLTAKISSRSLSLGLTFVT